MGRNGQPYTKPIEGNETVQNGNNTMVNYDSPNGENLDDFMRLDALSIIILICRNHIKASLTAGVMNITNQDNDINRYYKVNPNDQNDAIQVDTNPLA
jgi:hypothetical protein